MDGAKKKKTESKVEVAKRQSNLLRGSISETLASDASHFAEDDVQILKVHGVYQQDDRDTRKPRRQAGLEPDYSFMVRVAIPGGRLTADQYLALDRIADDFTGGTLRLTTRQGMQFHGVLKDNLKLTIAGVNKRLLTTLSACGDVERNVMACPAPLDDEVHRLVRELAGEIARQLRPRTRAYHEIWLDGEKVISTEEKEPFYGAQYLPRKFKTGIALDTDNCVDVCSHDCGLVAVVEGGRLCGFHVLVGGGMGLNHNNPATMARLAEPLGFVEPAHVVETVRTVAAVFRDHGNRADRKRARLKYLLVRWGIDRFRDEFRRRATFELAAPLSFPPPAAHDHLGPQEQGAGRWFYGVHVENGRIIDRNGYRLKTALRSIVTDHQPGVMLTPQQNLLLTDLAPPALAKVEQMLRTHEVPPAKELSGARRHALACPALPTCGLALAEAERVMPETVGALEKALTALGLRDEALTVRMTGCPNGCARTYTADIAFVGRKRTSYNIYVGGGLQGNRVVDLFAEDVPLAELVATVQPLLQRWAKERHQEEGFSDFYQRLVGPRAPRQQITGREEPTIKRLLGEADQ